MKKDTLTPANAVAQALEAVAALDSEIAAEQEQDARLAMREYVPTAIPQELPPCCYCIKRSPSRAPEPDPRRRHVGGRVSHIPLDTTGVGIQKGYRYTCSCGWEGARLHHLQVVAEQEWRTHLALAVYKDSSYGRRWSDTP